MLCRLVDVDFSFLFTYMRDDVVGGEADEGDDFVFKCLIGADLEEIFHTENDIFSAPKVPGAEFGLLREGRDSAFLIDDGEHIAHGFGEDVEQLCIARIFINEHRAAHHLSPILAAPTVVDTVDGSAELIDKTAPHLAVGELICGQKRYRALGQTRVVLFYVKILHHFCLQNFFIPFHDTHVFLHCLISKGTQKQEFLITLCHLEYCVHQNR